MLNDEELDKRFEYHPPDDIKQGLFKAIRAAGRNMAEVINTCVPEGRDKALAFTKLEEAIMWANSAIARNNIG